MEIRITYTVEQVITVPDDLSEDEVDEIVSEETIDVDLNELSQGYSWDYVR